jgi:hypothetical protein
MLPSEPALPVFLRWSRHGALAPFSNCLTGEVAERSKAAVLKTVEEQSSGGSNPSLSANKSHLGLARSPSPDRRRTRCPLRLIDPADSRGRRYRCRRPAVRVQASDFSMCPGETPKPFRAPAPRFAEGHAERRSASAKTRAGLIFGGDWETIAANNRGVSQPRHPRRMPHT